MIEPCWPDDHPNTVAFSAGAVCCHDEASARRHRDRATWWQHGGIRQFEHNGVLHLHYDRAERRWTR